jgi:hypothetical protein
MYNPVFESLEHQQRVPARWRWEHRIAIWDYRWFGLSQGSSSFLNIVLRTMFSTCEWFTRQRWHWYTGKTDMSRVQRIVWLFQREHLNENTRERSSRYLIDIIKLIRCAFHHDQSKTLDTARLWMNESRRTANSQGNQQNHSVESDAHTFYILRILRWSRWYTIDRTDELIWWVSN